jgi:hypothetical protein
MSDHTTTPLHSAPAASEYAPYYAKYVALIEGDALGALRAQLEEINALPRRFAEAGAAAAYEPGKWSVKELVGHLLDTERVFAYRALCFARGDRTPLPGFDQDEYVRGAGFNRRKLADIAAEFAAVREATLRLFGSLDREAWARRGTANESEVSVRALAYIAAGHTAHHFRILRERYLK